jgi:hypothetical protein
MLTFAIITLCGIAIAVAFVVLCAEDGQEFSED